MRRLLAVALAHRHWLDVGSANSVLNFYAVTKLGGDSLAQFEPQKWWLKDKIRTMAANRRRHRQVVRDCAAFAESSSEAFGEATAVQ